MTAPRPLPPQHTRYPVKLIALCQRKYADGKGLTPTQIRDHIAEHYKGPTPTIGTIRRWVIPAEADYQRALNANSARRRRERGGQPMLKSGHLEGDALDRRMLELRSTGLPYSAISKVVELYHGVALDEDKIRYRLRKLGVAPVAARSVAARALWASRAGQEGDRAAA